MKIYNKRLFITFLLLLMVTIVCLSLGRYPKAGFTSLFKLFSDQLALNLLLNIRLPRIILALLGGASLAAAGFVFQMIFGNPLVEPGFLGISQASSFGSALAILIFPFSQVAIQINAMFFGLLALFLSSTLAKRFKFGGSILRLVLAGLTVASLFSAALSFVKLMASPSSGLQDITFWLMGGLYNTTWHSLISILPISLISLSILIAYRWRLNLLALEDRYTHSIGFNVQNEKRFILFIATVATTAIISVSGIIGWVGLIVPHLARRLFGSDARNALVGSILLGSLFLLISDTLGRTLFSTEIPLGILTSIFGSIIFVLILSRKTTGFNV